VVPADPILERIDQVLSDNRRTETIFIVLAIALFLLGIAALTYALLNRDFVWASPSAVTTLLLYWPMNQLKRIRRENIALATVPALIAMLPAADAAAQLQRLLESMIDTKD
jgi:uncharacterized membrane protein YjjB (DUF3815 family)